HHGGRRGRGGEACAGAPWCAGGRHGKPSGSARGDGNRRSLAGIACHCGPTRVVAPSLYPRGASRSPPARLEVRADWPSRGGRSCPTRCARATRERCARAGIATARRVVCGYRGARVKALVTGASGFIGGAVARALLRQGAYVRALVRPGAVPNVGNPGELEI